RGEAKLQSWCRACFAEVNGAYYARNHEREKTRLVAQTDARRQENRRNIIAYLQAHPCIDCGERDIVVLEFDHRGAKAGDVSTYANSGRGWARVLKEIEACDVRCANCHRRRTALSWTVSRSPALMPSSSVKRSVEPLQLLLGAALRPRTCRICGVTKPMSDFPFRSIAKQTRQSICLACQRDYSNAWYARNRVRHVMNVRRVSRESKMRAAALVSDYLRSNPCVDCGEVDIVVLEFDHVRDKI